MRRKEPQWTAVERDGNGLILALLFNIVSDYTGWRCRAVFCRMSKATSTGDLFQEMVGLSLGLSFDQGWRQKRLLSYENICTSYKTMVDNG